MVDKKTQIQKYIIHISKAIPIFFLKKLFQKEKFKKLYFKILFNIFVGIV